MSKKPVTKSKKKKEEREQEPEFLFEPTWRWLKRLKIPLFHPPFLQIVLGIIIFSAEGALCVAIVFAIIISGVLIFSIAIVFYIPSLGHSGKLFRIFKWAFEEEKEERER